MMTSHLTPTCKFATKMEKREAEEGRGKERRDIPVFGIALKRVKGVCGKRGRRRHGE